MLSRLRGSARVMVLYETCSMHAVDACDQAAVLNQRNATMRMHNGSVITHLMPAL